MALACKAANLFFAEAVQIVTYAKAHRATDDTKSVWSFCGAPGTAHQATDIGAIHCGGVIEGKQGIMSAFFEFALANDAGSAAFFADVVGPRHDLSDGLGITDVLICCDF